MWRSFISIKRTDIIAVAAAAQGLEYMRVDRGGPYQLLRHLPAKAALRITLT